MPAELHFLHPGWFLALLPLALVVTMLGRQRGGAGAWQRVIEPQLLAALTVGADGRPRRWPLALLGLGWLLAVLALANPAFERVSVPAFRDAAARVVVLDLSQSMLADDLSPSRLERARFKVEDILRLSDPAPTGSGSGSMAAGQVGLVAFAGDAFAVAPLTDDADTIRGMLEALSPEIMPVQGSRPDLGIRQAQELLRQAGVQGGEVVLLTDDDGGARARSAAADLERAGHRLAVIGVGTEEGAVVPGVRTARGSVVARLDTGALRSLARHGGGSFARITADDSDLREVLRRATRGQIREEDKPEQVEIWKELGPWLALALAPLAAFGFRRGWLMLPLVVALHLGAAVPRPALAQAALAPSASQVASTTGAGDSWTQRWRDLWQRRDQQAAGALARGAFDRARAVAQDAARVGSASYRLGDFDAAARAFSADDSADAHYNRGNALARAGQLEDALAAYDAALEREPDMADAQYNRRQVEEALRRQQQSEPQQHDDQQQSDQQQSDRQQPNPQQTGQQQAEQQRDQSAQSQGPGQSNQDSQGQQADAGAEQEKQGENQGEAGDESPADQAQAQAQQGHADDSGAKDAASAEHATPPGEQAEPDATRPQQAAGTDAGDDAEQPAGEEQETAAEAERRRAAEAQAADDYRAEAAAARAGGGGEPSEADADAAAGPGELPDTAALESRQAADQWLRRIPDDPAGLLRRKFLYQYRMRGGQDQGGPAEKSW